MFGLRFASFAVAAILCGSATATPVPVHNPAPGEIVHIAPGHTTGGSVGTGAGAPHPHINLGHVGGGHYALAPVTHGTADHLKPYMPTPNEHGLGGVTRLDHVTGHASHISRSGGALRGKTVSAEAQHNIHEAKGLVQDHRNAAYAHGLAAAGHRNEQAWHDGQSAHHFQTGNAQLGAHHSGQSAFHAGHASNHEQAVVNHHNAANAVTGPNATERFHAQNSATHAHAVAEHFHNAAQHDAHSSAYAQQGNHPAAQQFATHAANSRASASHASTTSMTHHNSATGHHL